MRPMLTHMRRPVRLFLVILVIVGLTLARYQWPQQPLLQLASGLFGLFVVYLSFRSRQRGMASQSRERE